MNPLISVVIPVYNEEKRIARAVHSMQDQTWQNLEIIVVDDGSTDSSVEVVERIAKDDPRVTVVRNPKVPARKNWRGYDINAGWSARNHGFRIARGEWITTQDADDCSLRNRIETQYHCALKNNAVLVTVQWIRLSHETLGKTLDIERIVSEKGEEALIIPPEHIKEMARRQRGIFMIEPLHRYIPFPLKWFPYTRKLFYARQDSYPGADNSFMAHRSVFDSGYFLRPRNERTWGVPSGRGSGRDFVYRVAYEIGRSYSLRLPLYLWDVHDENKEYVTSTYASYLL